MLTKFTNNKFNQRARLMNKNVTNQVLNLFK